MNIKNSKGKVYYGMHFYPGVAEYSEPGKDPYRVFLNEDTIRSMDPTFAGRPIFVDHVDEVDADIDELKKEADGWVVESFYNSADGKHWVKFIVVSERAERAIRYGMRLSNAYIPKSFGDSGIWNGVTYTKEIKGGEYEHLAIVKNPRYEESVIMTPEQFKTYNEEKTTELKRLANSKDKKGETKMKLNIFKRQKVENSADLEGMSVLLPESKKEMTIVELVQKMDKIENMHGYASGDHMVKVGENEMSVNDLVKKHMEMCNAEAEKLKDSKETELDVKASDTVVDVEGDKKNEDEDMKDMENADEESDDEKKKDKKENKEEAEEKDEKAEKKSNDIEVAKKKAEAKKKADAIRNAHLRDDQQVEAKVEIAADQVARGKSRYGSN